jgi:hypothetical protein
MVTLLPFTFPGVHEGDAKVNDHIKSVSVSVRKEKSRVEFIALVLIAEALAEVGSSHSLCF